MSLGWRGFMNALEAFFGIDVSSSIGKYQRTPGYATG